MRRLGLAILAVVVVVAVGAAAFFFWPARLEDVSEARSRMPPGEATIRRGEYIARAADCEACHTLGNGTRYAGGLPFHLPFGTIYATNITPDKETGIGEWSDAEFVRALHHGVSRDGRNLYPAFPYTAYAMMSTEDALALKDYLFSLPPAKSVTPAADLSFPFNQRYAMRAWNLLFKPTPGFRTDPQQSEEWNRGAYLVEGLGHCGECHTPRNPLYALDGGKKFAGAVTAGWKAYNLTSNKEFGIGGWSDQQIADYLSKGHAEGRGAASGSMAEAVEYSLRYLTPEDIRAMVTYLRGIPPQRSEGDASVNLDPPAVRAPNAFTPLPEQVKEASLGLTLFQGACASCHAWNGEGLQHPHAALVGSQSVNDPKGTNVLQVILHGSHMKTNEGDVFMPSFSHAYLDTEIAALANYVIGHFGGKQSAITAADVAAARKASATP
ncbi:c-type cytochrome [Pseudoroseomonas ludipueritiae]|uniref:Cytochrome c n=1 Tax=Pseudoroseomonas ludipueritiae TaxID=198093 RepID=A0ABR7R2B5_9PROT|nr:cytochrome c [Pseudoroseomonas ludipueritiae]MBC9175876.1 cytochrome c [Pseudoroseomonas ludipueritiae]